LFDCTVEYTVLGRCALAISVFVLYYICVLFGGRLRVASKIITNDDGIVHSGTNDSVACSLRAVTAAAAAYMATILADLLKTNCSYVPRIDSAARRPIDVPSEARVKQTSTSVFGDGRISTHANPTFTRHAISRTAHF